ncbi:hypothetical protein GCM10029964_043090 [Kibdelosporangium lantanae]
MVAGRAAEGVGDPGEAVEVEVVDGEVDGTQPAFEGGEEELPVGQAGEHVVQGLVGELAVQEVQFRTVVQHDQPLVADGLQERDRHLRGRAVLVGHGLAGLAVEQAGDQVEDRVVGQVRVAEDVDELLVGTQEMPGLVGDRDPGGCRGHEPVELAGDRPRGLLHVRQGAAEREAECLLLGEGEGS